MLVWSNTRRFSYTYCSDSVHLALGCELLTLLSHGRNAWRGFLLTSTYDFLLIVIHVTIMAYEEGRCMGWGLAIAFSMLTESKT